MAWTVRARGSNVVETMPCPGGPVLVRGAAGVVDDDGRCDQVGRPVVAICRCRKSTLLPWCDGTHKLLPPERRP
jgi:hypothetical protein